MTDDDDYLPPQKEQRRGRGRWWYFPLFLLLFAGVVFWLFFSDRVIPTELERGTDRFRGAALAGNLDSVMSEFDQRSDRHEIAIRMAGDPDPRVRMAAAELLVRGDRRPPTPSSGSAPPWSNWNRDGDLPGGIRVPALNKLIKDENVLVRHAAIRAAGSIARTALFEEELLHTLWHDQVADRILVAQDLGHWNGAEAAASSARPSRSPPCAPRRE